MKQKLVMIAAILGVAVGGWVGGYIHGHKTSDQVVVTTKIQSLDDLEEFINTQPLALRANFLAVMAAHYSGSDLELCALLARFSERKLRELRGTTEL